MAQFFLAPVLKTFASDEEFFKYGSIGNDGAAGVPYPLWVAMPQVCANHLPPGAKGYEAFGFLWEHGRDHTTGVPVGFSRAKAGVERMSINCALCHSTRARLSADAEPKLYPGGAGNTIDIQGYQRFLSNCAVDQEFNADNLIPVDGRESGPELPREAALPLRPDSGRAQAAQEAGRGLCVELPAPALGAGAHRSVQPVKFNMLKLSNDGSVGNSDMLPLWNMGEREKRPWATFHWDGLTTSLRDSC